MVIAQYGITIVDNIMDDRLKQMEILTQNYFDTNSKEGMSHLIERAVILDKGVNFLNVVFFEKSDNNYKPFYKYPENFNEKKITQNEFRGYFVIDKKLYHGVFVKRGKFAILFATTINQKFLDEFSTISDFKIKFQEIEEEPVFDFPKSFPDTEAEGETFFLPHMLEFEYLDFDNIVNSKPELKKKFFLLLIDYEKTFNKIEIVNSATSQTFVRKLIYFLIFLFGTFIIISFIIGFRMIRVVTKSINQITKGIQRVRKGDFNVKIKTNSGDQLQYLADSFNEMASGISRLLVEEKKKQRLEEELNIARTIQLKLLPKDSLITKEFEIAATNIPASEIAGDYFDYFYKDGESLSILVADVSGKGTSAAFYMAELKGLVNYLQKKDMSPSTLLAECHTTLNESFDKVTFITISIAKFLVAEKKFILSRAGHTQAVFFSKKTGECIEIYPEGMALGLINFSKDKIEEIEQKYESGDILFLFSDGLSEIMNKEGEMLGLDPVKKIISENADSSPGEIKQKLLELSIEFAQDKNNKDDLTFIILKVK
ncbi:MAG: SpoIIE family protein phosphatase [Candidatus Aminicenantes bacterium]|nr:SpoIIE family protein phosphatase [Candidatus Aminicenantes bacterium]